MDSLIALIGIVCFIAAMYFIVKYIKVGKQHRLQKKYLKLSGLFFCVFVTSITISLLLFELPVELQLNKLEKVIQTRDKKVSISGTVTNAKTLKINGENVTINNDGTFEKEEYLHEGKNVFEVIGANNEFEESKKITIEYKVPSVKLTTPNSESVFKDKYTFNIETEVGAEVTVFKDNKEYISYIADAKDKEISVKLKKKEAYNFKVVAKKEGLKTNESTFTLTRELSKKEVIAEKMKNRELVPYKKLRENADFYTGKYTSYTGIILQIEELENQIQLQIAVEKTPNGYYYDYSTIIQVEFEGIVENMQLLDEVTFYGKILGNKTIKSVDGQRITVPSIKADIVD